MLCPFSFRMNGLRAPSYQIPIKELRLENNWLICRQMIVFAGNLLGLIYGLMILMSINYVNTTFLIQDNLFKQLVGSSSTTGVLIIIFAFFGCASLFVKSNFREFLANFRDSMNKGTEAKVVRYKGHPPHTVLDSIIDYMGKKLELLKRCFILSPIFTINALLITGLFPFEFSIVKNCIHYLIAHHISFKHLAKLEKSGILLVLCLNVLFISLIITQMVVLIYICDLINTSLDKDSQRKHYILELSQRKSPPLNRQLQNQIKIEALRQKNILFHHFLKQSQSSSESLSPVMSEKGRTLSEATTLACSAPMDQTSNYVLASSPYDSYAIYL